MKTVWLAAFRQPGIKIIKSSSNYGLKKTQRFTSGSEGTVRRRTVLMARSILRDSCVNCLRDDSELVRIIPIISNAVCELQTAEKILTLDLGGRRSHYHILQSSGSSSGSEESEVSTAMIILLSVTCIIETLSESDHYLTGHSDLRDDTLRA